MVLARSYNTQLTTARRGICRPVSPATAAGGGGTYAPAPSGVSRPPTGASFAMVIALPPGVFSCPARARARERHPCARKLRIHDCRRDASRYVDAVLRHT